MRKIIFQFLKSFMSVLIIKLHDKLNIEYSDDSDDSDDEYEIKWSDSDSDSD